jgi:hypothetical protein
MGMGKGGGLWSCSIDISSRREVVRRLWEMLEDQKIKREGEGPEQ